MDYTEWASDVRWWVALCYAIMIGAVIYTYIKLSRNGEGDGFAQNRRKGRRRLKEGRRGYDGEPGLATGYGKDKPTILDHDGDHAPDHDNRIL